MPESGTDGMPQGCSREGGVNFRNAETGLASSHPDQRFDLLSDLKFLMVEYLSEALQPGKLPIFSSSMAGILAILLEEERDGIADLRSLGLERGLAIAVPPRIDLVNGFAELAVEAGIGRFDPFATESSFLSGALIMNSLSQAVLAAWLCETEFSSWRDKLLRMLDHHSRFQGMINGAIDFLKLPGASRERELQAFISGPFVSMGTGEVLWDFDLLRTAIIRLACGGRGRVAGGFFPDGMSGRTLV